MLQLRKKYVYNTNMKNELRLIDRITDHFGSAYRAAKEIGTTHQQYYYWQSKGKIPFKRGKDIERATNGAIKAMEVWEDAEKYRASQKS